MKKPRKKPDKKTIAFCFLLNIISFLCLFIAIFFTEINDFVCRLFLILFLILIIAKPVITGIYGIIRKNRLSAIVDLYYIVTFISYVSITMLIAILIGDWSIHNHIAVVIIELIIIYVLLPLISSVICFITALITQTIFKKTKNTEFTTLINEE